MRLTQRAAATAAALLLAAGATACSSSDSPEPTRTAQTTVTAPAPLSKAEQTQQCVDAVASLTPNEAGEVPSEPTPAPCAPLTDSEYLDAYMDGIAQSNKAGQDELQRKIDEASEAAQP